MMTLKRKIKHSATKTKQFSKIDKKERTSRQIIGRYSNKFFNEAYDKGFNDGYTKGLEDGVLNDSTK